MFVACSKVAQRCYCGAENCRGWIGAEPDSEDEDDEEVNDPHVYILRFVYCHVLYSY